MKKIFGIEGLDGSGKTSSAKGLSLLLNIEYRYFTHNNPLARFREDADLLAPQNRFYYYLMFNLINYHLLAREKKQKNDGIIIVDRTPLSTVVYHEDMGVNIRAYRLFHKKFMNQYNQIFFLTARKDVIRDRIANRVGVNKIQKFDSYAILRYQQIIELFGKWLPKNSSTFDTSEKLTDEVIASLADRIQVYK